VCRSGYRTQNKKVKKIFNIRLIILATSITFLIGITSYYLLDKNIIRANSTLAILKNTNEMKNLYKENQMLKERMQEHEKLLINTRVLKKENRVLSNIVNETEKMNNLKPIQATVVSRNMNTWYETVILDKGAEHAIKENMAVITSEGLIGKITKVSKNNSTVELLTNNEAKNRIPITIKAKDNIFGTINGYDFNQRSLLIKNILTDVPINTGDSVVTSELGTILPANLQVGKVTKIEPDSYGLTNIIQINPSAEFYDISHVLVLKIN